MVSVQGWSKSIFPFTGESADKLNMPMGSAPKNNISPCVGGGGGGYNLTLQTKVSVIGFKLEGPSHIHRWTKGVGPCPKYNTTSLFRRFGRISN